VTLSQVDAHVGKHLFDNAILGALAGKTRILVTHALHFLPRVDYIICLEHGKVTQEGTYADLVGDKEGAFSKLMDEFGGDLEDKREDDEAKEEEAIDDAPEGDKKADKPKAKALMQEEERATGSVSGAVYRHIFTLAKGWYTFPVLLGSMVLQQAAQVLSGYILVWWQEECVLPSSSSSSLSRSRSGTDSSPARSQRVRRVDGLLCVSLSPSLTDSLLNTLPDEPDPPPQTRACTPCSASCRPSSRSPSASRRPSSATTSRASSTRPPSRASCARR